MSEDNQNKLQMLRNLVEELKKIEREQQTTIQHLARIQISLQDAGKENLSSKVGEIFGNASKNTDLLHEIIDDSQMTINQLK